MYPVQEYEMERPKAPISVVSYAVPYAFKKRSFRVATRLQRAIPEGSILPSPASSLKAFARAVCSWFSVLFPQEEKELEPELEPEPEEELLTCSVTGKEMGET